jgi:hypothetical protein
VGWGELARTPAIRSNAQSRTSVNTVTPTLCLHNLSLPIIAPFHVGVHGIHPNLRALYTTDPAQHTVTIHVIAHRSKVYKS